MDPTEDGEGASGAPGGSPVNAGSDGAEGSAEGAGGGGAARRYRVRVRLPNMETSDSDDNDDDDDGSPRRPRNYSCSSTDYLDEGSEGRDWDTDTDFTDDNVFGNAHGDVSDNDNENEAEMPIVLTKKKPPHEWFFVKELIRRETGLSHRPGKTAKEDVLFERGFYGSLHAVERLELMYKLDKHASCVNCINFHHEGELLASGSDDLCIVIWDWATNTCRQRIKTNHKSNIFQSRFLYLNSSSHLDIVSCARDGQVLLMQLPSSGGPPLKRQLAQHSKSAHKLYTNPTEPHVIVSAGDDGQVIMMDVRQEKPQKLFVVRSKNAKVPLYSVAGHPLDANQMCVAGHSHKIMVYDRRKAGAHARPVTKYCPQIFKELGHRNADNPERSEILTIPTYVTCAVYNHNGSEILASYNDDDIYLFDCSTDGDPATSQHGYTHMYSGHRNCDTFKGVSFFGPQSEYIVSGSDCANIYIWEKKTQAIVQWMMGDETGVVNCIECHPRFPILATSGLDRDVKIWIPSNENEPCMSELKKTVMRNARDRLNLPLFSSFNPRFYRLFGHYLQDEESGSSDSNSRLEDVIDEHTCRAF